MSTPGTQRDRPDQHDRADDSDNPHTPDPRAPGPHRAGGKPGDCGDTATRIPTPTVPAAGASAASVRVELAGQRLWLSTLRAAPQRWARLFESARRHPGYARCLCTPAGQKLVIRQVRDQFLLARWPDTSGEHVAGCPFFTSRPRSLPGHGRADPAITALTSSPGGVDAEDAGRQETTGVGVHVHLRARFSSPALDPLGDLDAYLDADAGAGSAPSNSTGAGPLGEERVRHNAVTLLGLVHYLWDAAGLSSYRAGDRRRWDECHEALAAALLTVHLGARARPVRAPELLHVVRPYRPGPASAPAASRHRGPHPSARGGRPTPGEGADPALATFLRALDPQAARPAPGVGRDGSQRPVRPRRLLLGEVKDLTPSAHGHKLRLAHLAPPLFLSREVHDALARSYRAAFSPRRGAGARRVALVLVERSPRGWLVVVDAALILTSSVYIPCDSSHEISMVDWLVRHGRSLVKPLRYESATGHGRTLHATRPGTALRELGVDGVLPDFILTDVHPRVAVEVWGITGRADYENRKRKKLELYRSAGTDVIDWDVSQRLPYISPRP